MNASASLDRLRSEEPKVVAAAVALLWDKLSREDPRMFAALWRKASHNV